MIQQIKIWNQLANILGNYAETQNARNSLNQHAFIIKIRSNQYIQLSYTTRQRKNSCTLNKDWFKLFSWELDDEQDKGKKITQLILYWFTQ